MRWSPLALAVALSFPGSAAAGTWTDDRGVQLRLEEPPRRIVSLAPHLTEAVFALDAGEQLVATVAYSDHPEAALALPRIGDAFRVDLERLIALRPDLILAGGSGNPEALIERIRDTGIPVLVLEPDDLEDAAEDLRLLAEVLDRPDAGSALADGMLEAFLELEREAEDPIRVFVQVSDQPVYTVAADSTIVEVLRRCGGETVFPQMDRAAAVTPESVAAAAPEAVLMLADEALAASWWDTWHSVGALPEDAHHLSVDPDLISRPGPRLVEGMRAVCAALAAP